MAFVQHGSKLLQVNIWDKVCVYDLLYFVTNILKDVFVKPILVNKSWTFLYLMTVFMM